MFQKQSCLVVKSLVLWATAFQCIFRCKRAGPEILGVLGDICKDFIEKKNLKKFGSLCLCNFFSKNLEAYVYVIFFKKFGGPRRMFHPALSRTDIQGKLIQKKHHLVSSQIWINKNGKDRCFKLSKNLISSEESNLKQLKNNSLSMCGAYIVGKLTNNSLKWITKDAIQFSCLITWHAVYSYVAKDNCVQNNNWHNFATFPRLWIIETY